MGVDPTADMLEVDPPPDDIGPDEVMLFNTAVVDEHPLQLCCEQLADG